MKKQMVIEKCSAKKTRMKNEIVQWGAPLGSLHGALKLNLFF